jgi:carbamate kinase
LALERCAPLDVLGAETQGQIGHDLASALEGVGIRATPVVTQVLVSREDQAFSNPIKFIGPGGFYLEHSYVCDTFNWLLVR